jgi:hypothetical protein
MMRFAHLKTHHGFERAAARPLRRTRRVPPCGHRAEPQDNGTASRLAAARPRARGNRVRSRCQRRPGSVGSSPQPRLDADDGKNYLAQPRSSERAKPLMLPTLSTASTHFEHAPMAQ